MGSPAYFARLVNFLAASRKSAFIPFGSFSPQDSSWLGVIASIPNSQAVTSIATWAFSPTPNIDVSTASVISLVLSANVTSCTLNYQGAVAPQRCEVELRITQDSTGGWVFPLPSNLVVDQGFQVDPG